MPKKPKVVSDKNLMFMLRDCEFLTEIILDRVLFSFVQLELYVVSCAKLWDELGVGVGGYPITPILARMPVYIRHQQSEFNLERRQFYSSDADTKFNFLFVSRRRRPSLRFGDTKWRMIHRCYTCLT